MTLSSIRIAVATLFLSFSWSSLRVPPTSFMCATMLIEPRLPHRDFVAIGIEGYLGAQVGAVYDADVLLWRTQLQGSLKVIHGCPVSKSIDSILAPELRRGNPLAQLQLALGDSFLVPDIGLFERTPVLVVQVRYVRRD